MKKLLFGLISILILGDSAFGKQNFGDWKVYAGGINNATITKTANGTTFKGKGIKSGYMLGSIDAADAWHNKRDRRLSITLTNSDLFTLYVPIATTNGLRYLTYTTHPEHINKRGKEGALIYLELDEDEKVVGKKKTITRNLDADLKRYEPNNKIIEINALMIRGDSQINWLELNVIENTIPEKGTVYEDGTTDYKWRVYAGGKENGKIKSDYDFAMMNMAANTIISLKGNGIKSGYILGGVDGDRAWHNKTQTTVKWRMFYPNNKEGFTIYIPIKTSQGIRYMTYTTHPDHRNKRGKEGSLIYMGINDTKEVAYFTKNLRQDLAKYEPNNTLLAVNGFMIRGSSQIDDIILQKETPSSSTFDKEKFKKLLELEKVALIPSYGEVKLHHPVDNIAWFTYIEEDSIEFLALYTLEAGGKELKEIYNAFSTCLIEHTVKFLENNTRMSLKAKSEDLACYGTTERIYNIEKTPAFLTEYSYPPLID